MVVIVALLSFVHVCFATNQGGCQLQGEKEVGSFKDGDVLLAGSIPINFYTTRAIQNNPFSSPPNPLSCYSSRYNVGGFPWNLAMAFAISEINQDKTFLSNLTLGMLVTDSCWDTGKTIQGVLWTLSGQDKPTPNYQCRKRAMPSAIIGTTGSTASIATAVILGLHRYPQVSFYSSGLVFSNKVLFPSFFRTIPSTVHQAHGLAQLVLHFGWTWVGLLYSSDDYGLEGFKILNKVLQNSGVCLAFQENLPDPSPYITQKTSRILEVIRSSSANVIIAFTPGHYLHILFTEYSKYKITGRTWISTEAWSVPAYLPSVIARPFAGTIGFAIYEGEMPGFKSFLQKVSPFTFPNDPFVQLFWETAFSCQWPKDEGNGMLANSQLNTSKAFCTGTEKMEQANLQYLDDSDLRINYNVYNAVYAVATALREMKSCEPGHGPFPNYTCADLENINPWQLFHYMRNLHFKNKVGEEMSFDSNGDPPALYDIINWQLQQDGSMRYIKVGRFDSRLPTGAKLYFDSSAIHWNSQTNQVPRSVCTESCAPGYRKAIQNGQPACCFDCIRCGEGEISNETDSGNCLQCPSDRWPNERRSECVPKVVEFLSYQDILGTTLTCITSVFSFTTAVTLTVFIKFRDTPIVKANNREVTYVLLIALLLSFLCPLLFIGEPQQTTCLLRQPAFGIIFVFCVSCVLAKTIMVVIAFSATKPGSNMRKWLGPQVPLAILSLCTLGQVLICGTWLLVCPSFPEKNKLLRNGIIIFQCNECSEVAFWCMLGYIGFLSCVSFLVAFMARKLPDSFNEAKWITFSMLVFLSVWLSFVPGYLSTHGKFMVAVEVFGIISSSAGLLTFIFVPKVFIILLRPHLNKKEYLFRKNPEQ